MTKSKKRTQSSDPYKARAKVGKIVMEMMESIEVPSFISYPPDDDKPATKEDIDAIVQRWKKTQDEK